MKMETIYLIENGTSRSGAPWDDCGTMFEEGYFKTREAALERCKTLAENTAKQISWTLHPEVLKLRFPDETEGYTVRTDRYDEWFQLIKVNAC
jgi:hypothetical protein